MLGLFKLFNRYYVSGTVARQGVGGGGGGGVLNNRVFLRNRYLKTVQRTAC